MNKSVWGVFAVVCAIAAFVVTPAGAQMTEVKEKPPMYSYVSLWNIPRGQWGEMEKADAGDQPILDKAMASGTLVGYGNDVTWFTSPTLLRTTSGGHPCRWRD